MIGVLVIIWNLAKLDVAIQTWGLFTGKCILRVVASQSFLIKNCGIPAEETPFGGLNHISIIVLDWKTNMKHLNKIRNITDAAGVSMSEIASCSYEARAAGIKNGMFMGSALKLCPDLQTIPYDFER